MPTSTPLVSLQHLLEADGVKLRGSGSERSARCFNPSHDDKQASLSVNVDRGVYNCHGCGIGGDAVDYLVDFKGVPKPEAIRRVKGDDPKAHPDHQAKPKSKKIWPELPHQRIATHTYRDAAGNPVLEVCRFAPGAKWSNGKPVSKIMPFSPVDDEQGRFLGFHPGNNDQARPLLYRLPELLAANPKQQVVIVEGEKCADTFAKASPSAVVTCWQHGAKGIPQTDWTPLKGRSVLLISDADEAGREAITKIGAKLATLGCTIRAALLPGEDHTDIHDWITDDPKGWSDRLKSAVKDFTPPDPPPETPKQRSLPAPIHEFVLAKQFAARTDGHLLNDTNSARWFEFTKDTGWDRINTEKVVLRIREFLLASNPEPADPDKIKQYSRESLGARIFKMVGELTAIDGAALFDQDDYLVGLPGGFVYDIKSGSTRKAKHSDYVTVKTACTPKPGPTPLWDRLFKDAFQGDFQTAVYVRRALGYAITGSTVEHRMLFLQGLPRTGKSTILNLASKLFGGYAKSIPSRTFVQSTYEDHLTHKADLMGPRLVWFSETGSGKRLDEESLNQVVAGDPVRARFMRQDSFEFVPKCKVFMVSNFRPSFSGPESGVTGRLRVIAFNHPVPPERIDKHLPAKLFDQEGPAILHNLLLEATAWHKHGLRPESEAIKNETASYFAESDPIGAFAEVNLKLDPNGSATRDEVYDRYTSWCESEGHRHARTKRRLTSALLARFKPDGVYGSNSMGVRNYRGLVLKPQSSGALADALNADERPF